MTREETNPICNFISFIEVLTNDEYEGIFEFAPSRQYYKNAGSYELVKTIKHFLPDSEVYVSNDFVQCALYHKGILYDIDGIIEDIEAFHEATDRDMEYLGSESPMKFGDVNPSAALIQDIMQCNIDRLIEKCRNMEGTPDFYKERQKKITA